MPYLGKQSEQVGVSIQKYEFLQATDTSSGTTSFSVPSDAGDHVNVWLNGVLLVEGGSDDYSKSNTAVTFNSAPADGDIIRIDVVESFALPDALKSSGDTMTGALKLDGGIKQQTSADLSGTYADHQVMLSDSYSVTGDVTISCILVLSKICDDSNAVSLTNDTSTRTITGTGSLEASTLVQTPNASLTGMTGTIGSAVSLNHDAQKYAWHRYITANTDVSSNATLDFTHSTYLGSGLTEAGGVITLDSSGGGLYLVSFSCHNHTNTANDHTWNIRVNGTNITGGSIYTNYNSAGSVLYYGPVGTISIPVLLDNSATVEIYGNGYVNGDETTTWFCGVRIGAKT